MTEKKPLYIDNRYFTVIFERDYDIPSYTICGRDFFGPNFFSAFDYKYNEHIEKNISFEKNIEAFVRDVFDGGVEVGEFGF